MSRVNTSLTRQNNLTIFSFEHRDINGLSVDWKNGQEWITKGVLIDINICLRSSPILARVSDVFVDQKRSLRVFHFLLINGHMEISGILSCKQTRLITCVPNTR